ncbi:MAG: hypothetical protein LBO71_09710, partial [Prevotellaceae bacterium]|nr:hypothetical protein [Prevotellaceae bacterium]
QAGWRFNEPEGEVLVYMGNELPLIQPPRRAYYLVLLSVSDELADGIYEINFDLQGNRCSPVTQATVGTFTYAAPRALLSIQRGSVANPLTLGQGALDSLTITPANSTVYRPFGAVKISAQTPITSLAAYDALSDALPVTRRTASVIDLSSLEPFPTTAVRQLHAVEKAAITCTNAAATSEQITAPQQLFYTVADGQKTTSSPAVSVNTRGPKIIITKEVTALNGRPYREGDALGADADGYAELTMVFTAENRGSGAENVRALYTNEGLFTPVADKIRQTCPLCIINGSSVNLYFGTMMSGSKVTDTLYYTISAADVMGSGEERVSPSSAASAVRASAASSPAAPSSAASSSTDWMAVLTGGDIRFESTDDRRAYHYSDTNATRVLFYELQPADVTLTEEKIIIGKPAEFIAAVKNYAYPVTQVEVSLYALNEMDTVFLCSGVIAQISTADVETVALQHKFTDARMMRDEKIRLLLKVNPHAEIPELDYNNDSQFFDAEVGAPNMEDDGKLVIFPNPAVTDVNFVYDDCLQLIRKMEMCLYGSKGGKLDCHFGTQCQVSWNLSSLSPGIYVVRIEVTLQDGSKKQYLRRLALER